MTKTFWSGPEIFVVIDDAGVWPTMDNPLMALGPHIEGARDTGLHVFAATAVANWNQVAIGSSVLGKLRASLAPILILDGRRDAGKIVADIFAEPQRPGKATYFTRSGTTGALIGWSNPPTSPSPGGSANIGVQCRVDLQIGAASSREPALDCRQQLRQSGENMLINIDPAILAAAASFGDRWRRHDGGCDGRRRRARPVQSCRRAPTMFRCAPPRRCAPAAPRRRASSPSTSPCVDCSLARSAPAAPPTARSRASTDRSHRRRGLAVDGGQLLLRCPPRSTPVN